MKQIQHGEYLLQELPKGSFEKTDTGAFQFYWHKMPDVSRQELTKLLSEPYNIIGKASDLTEDVWKEMFKESGLNKISGGGYVTESDFKTLATAWIKFKGLTLETTLILKKTE